MVVAGKAVCLLYGELIGCGIEEKCFGDVFKLDFCGNGIC